MFSGIARKSNSMVIQYILAFEIELKAHVEDYELIKRRLGEKAEYLYSVEKKDTYWFSGEISAPDPFKLRIRGEKRMLPDGSEKASTQVNYKIKEVRDGVEVNDEREFEISSSSCQTAAEFGELLKMIGLRPGVNKWKRGWTFYHQGINAELVEVVNLGWFLELEIIADNNNEETFAREKKRLLDLLSELGIEKDAIESRFYTEMLMETANE